MLYMYGIQTMQDLPISVDLGSPIPAYRQIVDQFRNYLVEGKLTPGEVLPGVRRLAIDLGVHFNTVAEAYRALAQEGWVEVSQGKAVRVVDRAHPPANRVEIERTFRQRLRVLVTEMRSHGLSVEVLSRELRAAAEGMKS